VDKSLLRVDANGRYDLHELLWQYAREKLTEADEAKTVLDRHRDYFLTLAESTEPEFSGANQIDWLNRVETELGNVRAAIGWSLESGDIAASLRLTGSLYWFWSLHGYHREGHAQLMDILSFPAATARTTMRAKALNAAGVIQWFEGKYAEARPLLEEAEAIAREVGDQRELALAVRFLGHVLYNLGEFESVARSLEESLVLARKLQDRYGIAWSLHFLGDLVLQQGNPERAQRLYEESIDLVRELKEKGLLALAARRLGFVMRGYHDYPRAKALCQESLELNLALGDRRGVAASLAGLAGLAVVQGHTVQAAQLLGAAKRLLDDIAAHLFLDDQREYEHHLESVRTQLDAPTFDRAWAEGQSMSMEQAAAFALEERRTPIEATPVERMDEPEAAHPQPLPDPLTTRELEVLHLMAQGMSNREIADRLVLAVGTVKWYGSQICSKLQVQNRVQAIARARGLHILL
jgi:ATP/maltotriose-dependent transcriptional regulator MalT